MLIYINLLQRELHRGWGSFLKKCTNISSSVQGWESLTTRALFLVFSTIGSALTYPDIGCRPIQHFFLRFFGT